MHAHLEITSAIIRVFASKTRYGAPFEFAVAVVGDGELATIKALSAARLTAGHYRACERALVRYGFTRGRYHRGDGRIIERNLRMPVIEEFPTKLTLEIKRGDAPYFEAVFNYRGMDREDVVGFQKVLSECLVGVAAVKVEEHPKAV